MVREQAKNLTLLIMIIIFYWVTLKYYLRTYYDPSGSLGLLYMYVILWSVTFILLSFFKRYGLVDYKTRFRKVGRILLTPIPIIILMIVVRLIQLTGII